MDQPNKLRWKVGDWGDYEHGMFALSNQKLQMLRPDLYTGRFTVFQSICDMLNRMTVRDMIAEHLWLGSVHPAIVISLDPVVVACYSSELDCVAMLEFTLSTSAKLNCRTGQKMLCVNYYGKGKKDKDIEFGPRRCADWASMNPLVVDFLTSDRYRIKEQVNQIPRELWSRVAQLVGRWISHDSGRFRDGLPYAAQKWKTIPLGYQ